MLATDQDLKKQIKAALDHALTTNTYPIAFDQSQSPNWIVLNNLTVEDVRHFYVLVKDELEELQTKDNVKLSLWLKESLNPSSKQNVFIHELDHVKIAETLGVDLSKCSLEVFFLTDGFGLQMVHHFIPPNDIDPLVKLRVALAPEELSESDINTLRKIITDHPTLLTKNDTLLTEIGTIYTDKTGKPFYSLLEEEVE